MMQTPRRLLTLNCHESWIYQLGYLGCELDIIDGLPGRYCSRWDTRMRPVPKGANLVTMEQVLSWTRGYDCIITHNITDLLDVKRLPGPRILVIHQTLDSRIQQHGLDMKPAQLSLLVEHFLDLVGGHAVAISLLKAKSWGFVEDVVLNSVDIGEYPPWSGEVAAGLRISNQISQRKEILLWDFHEAAFKGVEVRVVGVNPEMEGVHPSRDWDDLKSLLSSHRFFIHTAHPELEDGYNLAMLEAMAAGLPVLGNRHPTSPIEHGVNGFLSDDPEELGRYARRLLQDRDLAGRLGEAARKTVAERFGIGQFISGLEASIQTAQKKWEMRRLPDTWFARALPPRDEEGDLPVDRDYYFRRSDEFQGRIRAMELEEAVEVLNEIMKHLAIPTDRSISSFEDLIGIIVEVVERLRDMGENQTAETLLRAALMLMPAEGNATSYKV